MKTMYLSLFFMSTMGVSFLYAQDDSDIQFQGRLNGGESIFFIPTSATQHLNKKFSP